VDLVHGVRSPVLGKANWCSILHSCCRILDEGLAVTYNEETYCHFGISTGFSGLKNVT